MEASKEPEECEESEESKQLEEWAESEEPEESEDSEEKDKLMESEEWKEPEGLVGGVKGIGIMGGGGEVRRVGLECNEAECRRNPHYSATSLNGLERNTNMLISGYWTLSI